jgi:hypothetical protein
VAPCSLPLRASFGSNREDPSSSIGSTVSKLIVLLNRRSEVRLQRSSACWDGRGLLAGRRPLLRPHPLDETRLGVAVGPWPDCRRNVEGGCVSLYSDIYWLDANEETFHFPVCRKLGNGRA